MDLGQEWLQNQEELLSLTGVLKEEKDYQLDEL